METYDKLRVIAELEEEMREASSRLEFERAAHLRDQITALKGPAPAALIQPVKYPTGKSARGKRVSS
jgi:excinuclease ABC subunit B